jgi:YVTN family beta-propeller protein
VKRIHVLALVLAAAALVPGGVPGARAAGPTPTIATVVPAVGLTAGGTAVEITGTDFSTPMTATFGGVTVPAVVVDATHLTCSTPPHARGAVDVVVTQATAPPSPSAPAVGAFTYEEVPAHAWVPRTFGPQAGGPDLAAVDYANRRLVAAATLDLNPVDADLPTDDLWRISQVLFDRTGDYAYLATVGKLNASDSRKVYVVRTARLLGTEVGAPVVAIIDAGGNPYQLALRVTPARTVLYVANGGSWNTSSTPPSGNVRAWDVTNPMAPAPVANTAAVGILPVLSYDLTSYQGWGTNSSFRGLIQAKNGRCVVTNVGSHTLSVVDVETLGVTSTVAVGTSTGGAVQITTSIPSPFSGSDDFVYVQSTDLVATTPVTEYFVYRISKDELVKKEIPVEDPVWFFPVRPLPSLANPVIPLPDVQNRTAWPHPDGSRLVTLPVRETAVATWNPATGQAGAMTDVAGGGPPPGLAFNDVSGFFYARKFSGGWAVLTVAPTLGAAPVKVTDVADATGVDSLRVAWDGSLLIGTSPSALAILDGRKTSPTVHTVVDTVPLPLDPAGGPSFPQPAAGGAPARTFVAGPSGEATVVLPASGDGFCADDPPPFFEALFPADADPGVRFEVEIGTQYDLADLPGAVEVHVPFQGDSNRVRVPRRGWTRILRAAAGVMERPFYARIVTIHPNGDRDLGPIVNYTVCAAPVPVSVEPEDDFDGDVDDPPEFVFTPGIAGRYWIEFAGFSGFGRGVLRRFPVDAGTAGVDASGTAPADVWRDVVNRAGEQFDRERSADGLQDDLPLLWRVRGTDSLGRTLLSEVRTILLAGPTLDAPEDDDVFCAEDDPPGLETGGLDGVEAAYEAEIATGFDFRQGHGDVRIRVPFPDGPGTATPEVEQWLRVLRAAAGETERPFYSRVVAVLPDGTRLAGPVVTLAVCEAVRPTLTAPDDGDPVPEGAPPDLSFQPGAAGSFWIEIQDANAPGTRILERFPVEVADPESEATATVPEARWKRIVAATTRSADRFGTRREITWRVRALDGLGRLLFSGTREIVIEE